MVTVVVVIARLGPVIGGGVAFGERVHVTGGRVVREIYRQTITDSSAWKGSDFASIDAVSFALQDEHISALDTALTSVRGAGLTLNTVEKEHFDLGAIVEDLADIEREVLHGRGIVVLRGFPVDDYPLEDIEIMYWGLGCHLGSGESQSSLGDRIGRVEDVSGKDLNQRAYRNSLQLGMHTDLTDIIAMLSIRKSARGGLSTYVSASAIHNEILATRPECLEPLYRGFRYHRFGEEGPGEEPVTPHRIPVLSEMNGYISARYVPEYVHMAAEEVGEPLTTEEAEALACFEEMAMRPDLRLDVMLEPGDLSIINNYTVMHTRDAYYDGAGPSQKRLLLRLWLSSDYRRPVVDTLEIHAKRGIGARPGHDTYYTGPTDPQSQLGALRS